MIAERQIPRCAGTTSTGASCTTPVELDVGLCPDCLSRAAPGAAARVRASSAEARVVVIANEAGVLLRAARPKTWGATWRS